MTSWNFNFTQYEDYKGLLDEMRFWDKAKTEDELKTRWADAISGNEKGLVGYFQLLNYLAFTTSTMATW